MIVIVSICLGWYVDHFYRFQREILGTWHYSHGGYRTTLTIRPDKSFEKTQRWRTHGRTFEGTYEPYDGGVVFSILNQTDFEHTQNGPNVTSEKRLNETVPCRLAICNNGYLLIHSLGSKAVAQELRLNWESYKPANAR